jgi:hypothetical protein
MLDFLISDGTVVLLLDGDDEGSVLLMELLRAGFTGALVRISTYLQLVRPTGPPCLRLMWYRHHSDLSFREAGRAQSIF